MDKSSLKLGNMSTGVVMPLLLIAGIGFGYFMVWPQKTDLDESRAILAQKQEELSDRETALQSIKKLVAEIDNKRDQLALLDAALPAEPDVPNLLANIELLANQSGLNLTGIQVIPVSAAEEAQDPASKPTATVQFMNVNVNTTGQYPQLSAFILNLEQNMRIVDIQGVDFGRESDISSKNQNYVVRLRTYYQKNK